MRNWLLKCPFLLRMIASGVPIPTRLTGELACASDMRRRDESRSSFWELYLLALIFAGRDIFKQPCRDRWKWEPPRRAGEWTCGEQ